MAISSTRETATFRPMGDAICCVVARENEIFRARLLLCGYGEPWDAYFLHGGFADSVLVRIY
jgi:hypothetical protein